MGRGRAKAKQTKVARELKYNTPKTDFSALERELHGAPAPAPERVARVRDDDTDEDDYGSWASGRR